MAKVRPRRWPRWLTSVLAAAVLASPLGLAQASASARHLAAAVAADPAPGSGAAPCFFLKSWKGRWKTAPDSRAMYISVSHHVYRLDLAEAYPLLKSPWAVLVYRDSGSTICGPSDFRIVLSNQIGVRERIIVRKMTRLTPAEVAALPKKLRP